MPSRFSHVQFFATLWTVARQTLLSMGFSKQEYWSGLPFPNPGDFPNLRMEPTSLASAALAGRFFTTSATCGWSLFPGHPAPTFERKDCLDREKGVQQGRQRLYIPRESLGQKGDQTSQSQRKPTLNIHLKDWCWSWSSNTLATWYEELTHWKRPWCWERLKAAEEGDDSDEMVGWYHRLNGHEFE